MAIPHSVRRGIVAVLLLVAFVLQGTTSVLAGTTGSLSGTVVDSQSQKPIGGASVTASSPSQSATTKTDATGHFSFLSLAPDTYSVSVAGTGTYDASTVNGVTIQADTAQSISLSQTSKLKVIGTVASRAASALVKPGTTADVYSVSPTTQDKASAFGGGGTLNSAFSALTTVPGVYVAPNQNGYIGAGATLSIRGGDYDQIGYELDGVPVNRAFDNYPSGPASSLGQQELQVYTGAPAANAEANGISGYINQVIRTGTAPATRNLTLGIGSPTMYNKIAFEAGGANPSRTFSYYLGAGAYNQNYRYYDQFNGAALQQNYGAPLAQCASATTAPSCNGGPGVDYTNGGTTPAYVLGNYVADSVAEVRDRDTVANFHFGLPRKDGNRDDIQILYDNNFIDNLSYTSTNDQGGAAYLDAIGVGVPAYIDAYQSSLKTGTLLPVTFTGGGTSAYLFPQSPNGRLNGIQNCSLATNTLSNGCIEPNRRDAFVNNQGIVKAQYQHNFGTNAFLRVYGYTYYSDWLQTGPQSSFQNYLGFVPADYELHSHTRGVSAQFTDQLNSQHLLSIQGSYTTSNTLRDNNQQYINGLYGPNSRNRYTVIGGLVDSSNPGNGICYSQTAVAGVHAAVNCYNGSGSNLNSKNTGFFTLQQALAGTVPAASGTCGTGPCQYLVLNNGQYATYNTVTPKFTAASITDNWKPSDRINISLGLRYDQFQFNGSDTTNGGLARQFYYAAWNQQFPTAQQFNVSAQTFTYNELEPRFGITYTVDPRTVLRASYGRYAEAPNSAFEQYNFLQSSAPINLKNFVLNGIGNTPGHGDVIKPSVANNYDFSFEHQFKGDTSIKLTPFLRKTQDQIQQFYLDQKTNFVSGVNVGAQTSQGFEFELDKGDFSRNGLAAKLSFAYTNSYITYKRLKNGVGVIDGFNTAISAYNGFTKAGGGAPCYTTAGAADTACAAGSIANPYYNAPIQPLMDVNGKYATYDTFPGGVGAGGYTQYGAPYVGTLLVQYKRGPLAITPALQYTGGVRYGVPLSNQGIDPTSCGAGLASSVAGDPRYPYGAVGGSPFDATNCGTLAAIPNVYTGRFDNVGAFVAPSNLLLHTQITYDVNKRVTLVGNFANILNTCFGGTKVPFSVNKACGYTATYGAGSGPVPFGNAYNPGNALQPFLRTPYDPTFSGFPFNMYFEARIKI
ncbi:hypothetical protein WPS_29020 [Vulcanimicrobium alpinum]|uniref:TonB-dependent receptor n=1 Tax=Vulcanimicrobium alpinum TaxID=3016050 RepID=A0AAN1XZI0_UNVUL|nr:TonB-dependent receptor [Vulcanimicrobium alpinum]BDE07626.1 hypothetical protein WPS_29020 [Vulcanimicrobium alpinum]